MCVKRRDTIKVDAQQKEKEMLDVEEEEEILTMQMRELMAIHTIQNQDNHYGQRKTETYRVKSKQTKKVKSKISLRSLEEHIKFLEDTGAGTKIITEETVRRMKMCLQESDGILHGPDGSELGILGEKIWTQYHWQEQEQLVGCVY